MLFVCKSCYDGFKPDGHRLEAHFLAQRNRSFCKSSMLSVCKSSYSDFQTSDERTEAHVLAQQNGYLDFHPKYQVSKFLPPMMRIIIYTVRHSISIPAPSRLLFDYKYVPFSLPLIDLNNISFIVR